MPVHNAAPYLDEAIGSILNQTYRDFEFVILDDGSTDGSTAKLLEWAARDDRIRLHREDRNLGPAESSNFVVQHARGSLIARMDADDRSHPERLQRQVDLLQDRPNVGLVGTLCNVIDKDGRTVRTRDLWRLTRRSWFAPFPHGSIMFRRELFQDVGGYRKPCVYWEDLDLLLRMATKASIVTIPTPLYDHRHSPLSTRLVSETEFVESSIDLAYRCLDHLQDDESYENLLDGKERPAKVDPRVFVSLGSLELWAGQRPRLFRRMLRRADLGLNFRSLSALVWALWASSAPRSLRQFMRLLSNFRNSAARNRASDAKAVPWHLPRELTLPDGRLPAAKTRL